MSIASYIDHTILKQDTTAADISKLCQEALTEGFAAVCIPPYYIVMARQLLQNSPVKLATVVGFPLGYQTTPTKLAEISDAITAGVDEIDLVHNLAALKSGDWAYLKQEIAACTKIVHQHGKCIKVIVESGLLSTEELLQCCTTYAPLHIDYMKTSTGFTTKGADIAAVTTMRQHLPNNIKIKAAGGIRTHAFAQALIDAGADRLGCSASVAIVNEHKEL